MPKELIQGVTVKKLTIHCDERGRLMEMIRCDDKDFNNIKFGQIYMTTAYPGVVKAWHYHHKQTDHFVCVRGQMKVVLYDSRKDSRTHGLINEFIIGDHAPFCIEIPNYVYHGFKCVSDHEATVINFTTECYDYKNPDEYRVDPHSKDIPYDWARKDG